jgi:hypothetical protein
MLTESPEPGQDVVAGRVGGHRRTTVPSRLPGGTAYRGRVREDDGIVGDEQLSDGMRISVRLRIDFVVDDAARVMESARSLVPADEAETITCGADAVFALLEADGVVEDVLVEKLSGRAADGLTLSGWRAQLVLDEPCALMKYDCLRSDDVFALPPRTLPPAEPPLSEVPPPAEDASPSGI